VKGEKDRSSFRDNGDPFVTGFPGELPAERDDQVVQLRDHQRSVEQGEGMGGVGMCSVAGLH